MQQQQELPPWVMAPVGIAIFALLCFWMWHKFCAWRSKPLEQRKFEARAASWDSLALLATAFCFFAIFLGGIFVADACGIELAKNKGVSETFFQVVLFFVCGPLPIAYGWLRRLLARLKAKDHSCGADGGPNEREGSITV